MSNRVMRCKLKIWEAFVPDWHTTNLKYYADQGIEMPESERHALHVRMGAVWEGSTEAQVASENAIFGAATPQASFDALIRNPAVIEKLLNAQGKEVYVDFTVAE